MRANFVSFFRLIFVHVLCAMNYLIINSGCKRLRVVISECYQNSSIHGKRNLFSEYLENSNKKNAQCVHTIAWFALLR